MRIVGGIYKSRHIKVPKGVDVRPTSDRTKEALFSILGGFIKDKCALDLFSGSGNLGLEAISRGAKEVTFVDKSPRCVRAIRENIRLLGIIEDRYNVILKDALSFIKETHLSGIRYDLVLLDPPYYHALVKKTLNLLDNHIIITSSGLIVAEHYKKDQLPNTLRNIVLYRQCKYGQTILSFFKQK